MKENEAGIEFLAEMVNGRVDGDKSFLVKGFAPLESACADDISFLVKANERDKLKSTKAGAIIVPTGVERNEGQTFICVKDPYLAVAIIHGYLVRTPFVSKGIHARAFITDTCQLGKEISVGPMVVIGERVKIGERVELGAGTVVGDGVEIGDDSIIKANVTLYCDTVIGKRVIIHSGTVIGSDGYGYSVNERGEHLKRPQVGVVRIGDDVEIGANCCIDRATYGETWIKSGVKIDNLVQVAHNVIVGENSLLVAQVGLSGSTTLGKNVVMGGQSATGGHLVLGDRVMIAARGAVNKNQPAGAVLGGAPGLPIRQWAKSVAIFAKLPDLQNKVRNNSRAIAELNSNAEKEDE